MAFSLLEAPSILVNGVPTPVIERGLHDAAVREAASSPDELLAEMVRTRDTVARAWSVLEPELSSRPRTLPERSIG